LILCDLRSWLAALDDSRLRAAMSPVASHPQRAAAFITGLQAAISAG